MAVGLVKIAWRVVAWILPRPAQFSDQGDELVAYVQLWIRGAAQRLTKMAPCPRGFSARRLYSPAASPERSSLFFLRVESDAHSSAIGQPSFSIYLRRNSDPLRSAQPLKLASVGIDWREFSCEKLQPSLRGVEFAPARIVTSCCAKKANRRTNLLPLVTPRSTLRGSSTRVLKPEARVQQRQLSWSGSRTKEIAEICVAVTSISRFHRRYLQRRCYDRCLFRRKCRYRAGVFVDTKVHRYTNCQRR